MTLLLEHMLPVQIFILKKNQFKFFKHI